MPMGWLSGCNNPLGRSLVNSVGFLADAYDLFVIDFVVAILAATAAIPPSVAQKGLIVSSTLAGAVVGQLGFGLAADMLGRRIMFITSAVLVVIGSLASSLTGFGYSNLATASTSFTVFEQLALCRFFLGIGIGGEYPLSATVASEGGLFKQSDSRGAGSAASTTTTVFPPTSSPHLPLAIRKRPPRCTKLRLGELNMIACMFSMQGVGMLLSPLMVMLCLGSGVSLESTWRLCLAIGALPSLIVFYFRWAMEETAAFKRSRQVLTLADISASPNKEALLARLTEESLVGRKRRHSEQERMLEEAIKGFHSSPLRPNNPDNPDNTRSKGGVGGRALVVRRCYRLLSHRASTESLQVPLCGKLTVVGFPEGEVVSGGAGSIVETTATTATSTHALVDHLPPKQIFHVCHGVSEREVVQSSVGSSNRSIGGSDLDEEKIKHPSGAWNIWALFPLLLCRKEAVDRNGGGQNLRRSGMVVGTGGGSSAVRSRCNILGQRMIRLVGVFKQYRRALVGTAFCWFLTDVTFYGTGSFKSAVVGQWFGAGSAGGLFGVRDRLMNQAEMACVVAALSLPGYILSVLFIHKTGLKALQFWGYLAVALTHCVLALQQYLLRGDSGAQQPWRVVQLIVFGLSFLFTNFGPNTVNFIIPTTIYPSLVRASCHGFSAAMGKLGGVAGTSLFGVVEHSLGLSWLLFFAGCVDILGAVVTKFFIPDDEDAKRELMQAEIDSVYPGLLHPTTTFEPSRGLEGSKEPLQETPCKQGFDVELAGPA